MCDLRARQSSCLTAAEQGRFKSLCSVLRAGGWLRLHAGLGVCVHLQLWVEKATGEVSMGESGDPRKNLRGIWGRRAGVREVAQLGGLSRCALHCGGWLGPWWTKQRI